MQTAEQKAWLIGFGQRVRECREQIGLTQEQLASKAGYKHKTSISKIERGINDIPQSAISALADALNTTVEHLMGWDDADTAHNSLEMIQREPSIRPITESESLAMAWEKASYDDKMSVYYILKKYGMAEPSREDTACTLVS